MEPDQAISELRRHVDAIEMELGSRVALLERQVGELRADVAIAAPITPVAPMETPPPPAALQPAARPTTAAELSTLPPPPSVDQQPPPPTVRPKVRAAGPSFELGTEAILRWTGISLVVLAAVFLVSTAISRGWIGPELQLLGATLIGLGLLATAFRLPSSRRPYAIAAANGGAAVLIVCAGAAHIWLGLYDALTGLIMVAIAAVISVLAATKLRMESVAVTATAAMLLVPTWAEIIADAPVTATGIWLGLFAIAATAIGVSRGWTLYRTVSTWSAALWVLGLASVLYVEDNTEHVLAGITLVAVVGVVAWLNPVLGGAREPVRFESKSAAAFSKGLSGFEHRTALLVPLWTWATVLLFGGWSAAEPGGVIGISLAAGFAAVAVVSGPLQRWISDAAFGSHLLGASLLVTVSVVAWIGGPTLMVVLAAQALAILLLGGLFPDSWLKINAYGLASIAALLLLVGLGETVELGRTVTEDNIAHGIVVACLVGVAWLTARREHIGFSHAVNGLVWLSALAYIGSLFDPFIDDRGWLVVGVVLGFAGLAANRLGPWVLSLGLVVMGATVFGAAVSIVDAAANGTDLVGHLANLSVVAGLIALTWFVWAIRDELDVARVLFVFSWVAGLAWLASVLVAAPQGQVAVSVVWAIAACSAIVAGIRSDESVVRAVGLGTLALVLAKLLTVDLAEVDTLWRVGLFMVIGLGLLRLGYVLPSLSERFGQESSTASSSGSPP